MAVSLLRPGWESQYEGNPPFHSVGTIGRVEDLQAMPDGRFYLRLVGLARVRFGETVSDEPYRSARYETLLESVPDEADPKVHTAKIGVLTSHGCLLRELSERGASGWILDENIDIQEAVNVASSSIPVDPEIRQSLLEEDDLRNRMTRAAFLLDQVLERVLRLKSLRDKGNGTTGVN